MTEEPINVSAVEPFSTPPPPPVSPPPARHQRFAEDDNDVRNAAISLNLTGAAFATVHDQLVARAKIRIAVAEADADMQLAAAASRRDHLQIMIDATVADDVEAQHLREIISDLDRQLAISVRERDDVQRELHLARFEAERLILDEELTRLDEQEREDLDRLAAERQGAYESAKEHWEQTKTGRDVEIAALKDLRVELAAELERRLERVRSLNDPLVSRTVATFLVWVGYAAAAATGLCIGELLARGTTTPSATLAAAFGAWMNIAKQYMHPLALMPVAAGAILAVLSSIAGVAWLADWLAGKMDKPQKNVAGDRQRRAALPSFYITRDSYPQLISALPFAYALGLFFAFISIIPLLPGGLPSSSPVATGQVVGNAFGFLAAGMFVLYLTRILEPRLRRRTGTDQRWYHAWEIALLPLILIAALIVATIAQPNTGAHWGALATFMASAMLTLAYGMVLRGVFRDIDYSDMRLRRCVEDIDDLTEEVTPKKPGKIETLQRALVIRDAQRARRELTALDRLQRIRRTYAPDPSQDAFWLTLWLAARLRIKRSSLPANTSGVPASVPTLADSRIAPATTTRFRIADDAVKDVEHKLRIRRSEVDRLGFDSDRRLRIAAMREEQATLAGRIAAESAEKVKHRGTTEIETAEEDERFVRAWYLAEVIKPPFEVIRAVSPGTGGDK